jgi:hypothetical protein
MENEQKKDYIKPELSVVEFEYQTPLLDCSGGCDYDEEVVDTEWIKP